MKKKKSLIIIAILSILLTMFTNITYAETKPNDDWRNHTASAFEKGKGSKEQPYLISSPEQLAYLAILFNDELSIDDYKNKYFELTNDIDLSKHIWNPIGAKDSKTGKKVYFQGYFNGNHHTISGLHINDESKPAYSGLFGYIQNPIDNEEAVIKNLNIKDADIKVNPTGALHTESFAGILAGYATSNSSKKALIENVNVSGDIIRKNSAYDLVVTGGMIGQVQNVHIQDCSTSIRIDNPSSTNDDYKGDYAGGLVGMAIESIIEDSVSEGQIVGAKQLGGFLVNTRDSLVQNCESYVDILSSDLYVGGFAAISTKSVIKNSVAYGTIESTIDVENAKTGGFIGNNSVESILSDCFFVGKISGSKSLGAFAGTAIYGKMEDCYFDNEKNDLNSIGFSTPSHSSDISGVSSQQSLALICEKLGHKFSEWALKVEGNCLHESSYERLCEKCHHVENKTAQGFHAAVKVNYKKATAIQPGNIEYWYCEICQKYFRDSAFLHEISKEDTILHFGEIDIPLPPSVNPPNGDVNNGSTENNAPNESQNANNIDTGDHSMFAAFAFFALLSGSVLYGVKKNMKIKGIK